MARQILIKGGQLIPLQETARIMTADLLTADLLIEGNRIAAIEPSIRATSSMETIDARDRFVLPGFVQTHIHLCQTLFRGAADDLSLLDWLKQRIWPMEAAHDRESIGLSARLGIAEMIRGGTTRALTMESVNHTDSVFEEVERAGFRATVGKCMMDSGEGVPEALHEDSAHSIEESLRLLRRWHGQAEGRIRYCFAPRFAISCTRSLLEETARLAREHGVIIHTHASENREEIAMVRQMTGLGNIEYLHQVGLTGRDVVLAHCVHLNQNEIEILATTQTQVAHCPSSNLKLASGIAPVVSLLENGINVSLGADGAPCNNRLDMFTEMRTATLLQKSVHGPRTLPARQILRMATIGGARAIGLADQIGSLEIGKQADLQILDLEMIHTLPHPDPISTIVFAAQPQNVETVIIDGRIVMRDRRLLTLNEATLTRSVKACNLFKYNNLQS